MQNADTYGSPLDKADHSDGSTRVTEVETLSGNANPSAEVGNEIESSDPAVASTDSELTAEEVQSLKAKAAKAEEYYDRWIRQTADFENYKKRITRERQEASRYALQPLLEKLIPIVDNFEMALAAVASTDAQSAGVASLRTGVAMIHSQLKNVLAEAGLEEINAVGQVFDPTWHEAVSNQESSEAPEGTVLQQTRKGYKLKDRLVRPASVIVAKTPGA